MSRPTTWFDNQQVDQYIDTIANKLGKGSGGEKQKVEDKNDDLTQMIADLKK